MKRFIAIDLGATSGRVIVGNLSGLEVMHRFPTYCEKLHNSYFWDIIKIYSEIKKGLSLSFAKYGSEIVSIAIDSWGVDYALLDRSGSLLSPLYHYRDPRTKSVIDPVLSQFESEYDLFQKTGNALAPYNTLFQLVATKKERSSLLSAAHTYLSVPDFIAYLLCGVLSNEITEASTTQLYDSEKQDWNYPLMDLLGLPSELFLKPQQSGTILGPLSDSLMREFSLHHEVKVVACATHDTASALATVSQNGVFISSGTWSLIGVNRQEKALSKDVFDAGFTNECGCDNTITLVKNINGMWLSNSLLAEEFGADIDWKQLDASTIEHVGYTGVVNPLDPVFLQPTTMHDTMKNRIKEQLLHHGYSAPTCIEEYLVAIYRGLATVYAESLQQLETLSSVHFSTLYIIGGGAKNAILNQMTADLCGVVVEAGPFEATAIGNILLQAKALGVIESLDEGRAAIQTHYHSSQYFPHTL